MHCFMENTAFYILKKQKMVSSGGTIRIWYIVRMALHLSKWKVGVYAVLEVPNGIVDL